MQEKKQSLASPSNEQNDKRKNVSAIVALLIIIACIVLVIVRKQEAQNAVLNFLDWVARNPYLGALCYIGVYAAGAVVFFPGSILSLGAGFVFFSAFRSIAGVALGVAVVFIGAQLGSIICYVLARTILRKYIERRFKLKEESADPVYVKFRVIDGVLEAQGFKMVSCLRLTPLIPFNLLNFLLGISSVSFRAMFFGNFFMLPGVIAYVGIGSTLGSLAQTVSGNSASLTSNPGLLALTIVGTVIAIALMIYLSRMAKLEVDKVLKAQQQEKEQLQRENSPERAEEMSPSAPFDEDMKVSRNDL